MPKFINDIDLDLNELIQVKFERLSSDPALLESRFWYNTTEGRAKYFDTTVARTLATMDDIFFSGTEYPPVISILNTPPGSPTTGDRYLIGTSPTGVWLTPTDYTNAIAEWDGLNWIYTVPVSGSIVYVTATLTTYRFDTSWVAYNGAAILQNGNSFGATLSIGTNDNFAVKIKQNNADRFEIRRVEDLIGNNGLYSFKSNIAGAYLDITPGNTTTLFRSNKDIQFSGTSNVLLYMNQSTGKVSIGTISDLNGSSFRVSRAVGGTTNAIGVSFDFTVNSNSVQNRFFNLGPTFAGTTSFQQIGINLQSTYTAALDTHKIGLFIRNGRNLFGSVANALRVADATVDILGETSNNTTSGLIVKDSSSITLLQIRNDGGWALKGGTVGTSQTGYAITNPVVQRTLNVTTGSLLDVKKVLGTLIDDLKLKGIILA